VVSVVIFFIHRSTRQQPAKEPADVPMQGVFADTPENLQVQQTQPSVHQPSVNVQEVDVVEPVLPEASGLYNLVAKDIDGNFQQLSQYAVRGYGLVTLPRTVTDVVLPRYLPVSTSPGVKGSAYLRRQRVILTQGSVTVVVNVASQ
jgi:hypothetical protein